jgi:predicted nuclease with TOPRIM domain
MSDERELRQALEAAQAEIKRLRGRIDEIVAFDPEALHTRIARLERENADLKQRLDRADEVREEWDARVRGLRRELEIARQDQDRLRSVLENERLAR